MVPSRSLHQKCRVRLISGKKNNRTEVKNYTPENTVHQSVIDSSKTDWCRIVYVQSYKIAKSWLVKHT